MSASITGGQAVGHPVDVASGNLFHEFTDHSLPGRLLLMFRRRYSGGLLDRSLGMFGAGWSSPFEMELREDVDGFRMRTPEGDGEIQFDCSRVDLERGEGVLQPGAFHELRKRAGIITVAKWNPFHEDVTHFEFGSRWQDRWLLSAIHNADGRSIRIRHDPEGRVVRLEQDRERRGYRLEYRADGRVSRVHCVPPQPLGATDAPPNPGRLVLRYDYDEAGRLREMYDAAGNTASYGYDANGRLTRETTLSGMVFEFAFDRAGRCVETRGHDGFDRNRLEIDAAARITRVTNAAGFVTTYRWNESGQILEKFSPLGNLTATEYDIFGRIVAQTRPNGATTRHHYDARGDRILLQDARGGETSWAHNDRHQIVWVQDPMGRVWKRELDDAGCIVGLELPTGDRWTYGYNRARDLVSITNPLGTSRRLARNEVGDLVQVTDGLGQVTSYEYDSEGRLTAVENALSARTECSYDVLGQLSEVRLPDGSTRRFERNAYNQITRFVDELRQETRIHYGGCGAVLEVDRPSGALVELEWTAIAGQLAAVRDGLGRRQLFEYDPDGRCVSVTDFAGRCTRFAYDAGGAVTEAVDARSGVTKYERDALGTVTAIEFDDASRTEYEYDPCGNLIRADNGECPVEFELDLLGRIVSERQGDWVITSDYDVLGRRTRRKTSRGHETHFDWDANGSIERIRTTGVGAIAFAYDARAEVARWIEGGAGIRRNSDSRGRMREQVVGKRIGAHAGRFRDLDVAISRRSFDFDAASNLVGIRAPEGDSRFVYDADSRVVEVQHPGAREERFTHDAADNVTSARSYERRPDGGVANERGGESSWLHGAGNELLSRAVESYQYDDAGQRIAKRSRDGVTGYEWSRRGELKRVVLPDGSEWRYSYDAFGRRVAKEGPTGTQRFLWDGDVVLDEISDGPDGRERVVHWEFDPRGFDPIARIEGGSMLLCVVDATHLPRELVDASGAIAWRADYETFGAVRRKVARDGVDCPLRFPGQWFDEETGLHYNRFRYFAPEEGRYISRDPLGIAGGLNGYAYPRNPFSWIDPYGLTKLCGHVPDGATILEDKSPNYLVYQVGKEKFIIFKADQAVTLGPANPGRNMTTDNLAGLNENGQPYVHEGRHRAIGVATRGDTVTADNGGVPGLPGYLKYDYSDSPASGGMPVKDLKIDYSQPDTGKDAADQAFKDKHGF